MQTKICTKCNQEKDINCFSLNKQFKDGRCYSCKECLKKGDKYVFEYKILQEVCPRP